MSDRAKDLGDCFVSAGASDSSDNPFGRILENFRFEKKMTWHELAEKTGVSPVKLLTFAKSFSKENLSDDDKNAVEKLIDYFEINGFGGKRECLQIISGLSDNAGCPVPSDLMAKYEDDFNIKGPRGAAHNLVVSLKNHNGCCPN